jgi:hypothetical protein
MRFILHLLYHIISIKDSFYYDELMALPRKITTPIYTLSNYEIEHFGRKLFLDEKIINVRN